jgi:hypothetical protein
MSSLFSFLRRICASVFFPLAWTIFVLILLCIPGYALPGMGFLGIRHLDKIAHVVLFGGFVLFWGLYAWNRHGTESEWTRWLVIITLLSIGIGVGMEYFQINFIPNRSFDDWDIVADAIGSVLVMIVMLKFGKRWKLIA